MAGVDLVTGDSACAASRHVGDKFRIVDSDNFSGSPVSVQFWFGGATPADCGAFESSLGVCFEVDCNTPGDPLDSG